MKNDKIAWLSITSFVGYGGRHFYGRIRVVDGDPYDIEVEKTLTRTGAEALNIVDRCTRFGYKAGDSTGRFDTEAGLKKRAVEVTRETWPQVRMVVVGSSMALPEGALWCVDKALYYRAKEVAERSEHIYTVTNDPWRGGYGSEMDGLYDEWSAIVSEVNRWAE